ncbi:PorV/PorQ family protein [Candidatus Cloacimonadota bacterium]
MKKILLTLILINVLIVLTAETSGEYGWQMLKISSGVDCAAQGGAGAFSANDAFGFLNHPTAGLLSRNKVISLAQNYWLFDTTLNSGAYINSQGNKSFGFAYRYLDYGELDNYDDVGNFIGEYHPMDMVVTMNFGYRITPDHYAGINVNALYEKILTSSSYGVSFDLGYTYLAPFQGFQVNAALKNLGTTSKMDVENIDLPISGEIGFVQEHQLGAMLFSGDLRIIKYIDDDELKSVLGIRCDLNKILNLKAGYKFNHDAESFTVGFGVDLKKIYLNYAFIPLSSELDDAHILGLTYKF